MVSGLCFFQAHNSVFRKPTCSPTIGHFLNPAHHFKNVDLGISAPHGRRSAARFPDDHIHHRACILPHFLHADQRPGVSEYTGLSLAQLLAKAITSTAKV